LKFFLVRLLLSLFLTVNLNADWAVFGIAIKCDKFNNRFDVLPIVTTSSPENDIKAPRGFINLKKDNLQNHVCLLDNIKIELNVSVYGPQPKGMGQGSGVIIINKLKVNDTNLISSPTNFNWIIMNEKVLTEIHIKKTNETINSKMCVTDGWGWWASYENKSCQHKILNFRTNKNKKTL